MDFGKCLFVVMVAKKPGEYFLEGFHYNTEYCNTAHTVQFDVL